MRVLTHVFVASLLLSASGCVRHVLRPPETQEQLGTDPPPGKVAVNVVSARDDQQWAVYAGGDKVCATPCTRWFGARQPLMLRSLEGEYLEVLDLGDEAVRARRALLVAEGTSYGKRVNGIVFTTLGGMGVVTAITFTAVGCSNLEERGGLCTAGLITGAAAVPLTAVALWMLIDSSPRAHILPVFKSRSAEGQSEVRVSLLPNGLAGTF